VPPPLELLLELELELLEVELEELELLELLLLPPVPSPPEPPLPRLSGGEASHPALNAASATRSGIEMRISWGNTRRVLCMVSYTTTTALREDHSTIDHP
jgi:hypothetical protein